MLKAAAKRYESGELAIRERLETIDFEEDDQLEKPISMTLYVDLDALAEEEEEEEEVALDLLPSTIHPHSAALGALRSRLADLPPKATVWQTAGVGAFALAGAVGARAVVVHAVDTKHSELRVVGAEGRRAHDLLGGTADIHEDLIGSSVLEFLASFTLNIEGSARDGLPERLRLLGATSSVHALPVMVGSRCVAILEVIDARASGACFGAMELLAERIAACFEASAVAA
jgi:hypothetical protein